MDSYFKFCYVAAAAKSLQSCPTLCDPIDGSPPDSSVPGILQAGILEWVAISFSNACMHAKSRQSCLTLCDPMDSRPPGSSVHKILQARILEWFAISFSISLVVQWQRLHTPNAGDPSQISGCGTGCHMLQLRVCMKQLKIPYAAMKTCTAK